MNPDENKQSSHVLVSRASERFEAMAGVMIAVFASILALTDLVGGNINDQKSLADVKHIETYNWYQSKSLKQTMQENHFETLRIMNTASHDTKLIATLEANVKAEIEKYKKEKKEILFGSANIPKNEWAQDLDGELGKIIGVKEWEKISAKLSHAASKFDLSKLLLHICLVLGAVSIIIMDNPPLQKSLLGGMITTGILGIIISLWGYTLSI
jgi:hypothetical protein